MLQENAKIRANRDLVSHGNDVMVGKSRYHSIFYIYFFFYAINEIIYDVYYLRL